MTKTTVTTVVCDVCGETCPQNWRWNEGHYHIQSVTSSKEVNAFFNPPARIKVDGSIGGDLCNTCLKNVYDAVREIVDAGKQDPLPGNDAKLCGEAAYYAKKDEEARRLRDEISKKQALRATLDGEIAQLKKKLDQAEYTGD